MFINSLWCWPKFSHPVISIVINRNKLHWYSLYSVKKSFTFNQCLVTSTYDLLIPMSIETLLFTSAISLVSVRLKSRKALFIWCPLYYIFKSTVCNFDLSQVQPFLWDLPLSKKTLLHSMVEFDLELISSKSAIDGESFSVPSDSDLSSQQISDQYLHGTLNMVS